MNYEIFIALLSFFSATLGSAAVLFLGLKRFKPETRNLDSESDEHSTTAVKTAVESTEIVTRQLNATLADLAKERAERKEERKNLEIKITEINNQLLLSSANQKDLEEKLEAQRIDYEQKLEAQRIDYEKKLYQQKGEFERKFDIMRGSMAQLANQVVQLGGTPIKLMGE